MYFAYGDLFSFFIIISSFIVIVRIGLGESLKVRDLVLFFNICCRIIGRRFFIVGFGLL